MSDYILEEKENHKNNIKSINVHDYILQIKELHKKYAEGTPAEVHALR